MNSQGMVGEPAAGDAAKNTRRAAKREVVVSIRELDDQLIR
jgi:hypothetical protein